MIKWLAIPTCFVISLWGGPCWGDEPSPAREKPGIEVRSLAIGDRLVPLPNGGTVRLGPFPKKLVFGFGATTNASRAPIRLRYKLEGVDPNWREGLCDMFLAIRFYNDSGDQIDQKTFRATGESAGWMGELKNSSLTHRRETVTVPPQASRLWAVISSAGPPSTVGIYVVDNLVISRLAAENVPEVLLHAQFDHSKTDNTTNDVPIGWVRDGLSKSMARIVEVGQNPAAKAFAILDTDPNGHAEWRSDMEHAPQVTPSEPIVVEWNEMFSMGKGDITSAQYDSLPPGTFRFQVQEVTALGVPTGVEAALVVLVPPPIWDRPWFWGAVLLAITGSAGGSWRYLLRQRMRREVLHLKNQQEMEQERLRIAHDIHDDLGARVTQISLLSAMAHDNSSFPEKARADFDQISRMSRDLVSALYQTVWAVNPENDNLDALVNYLCQMVNQLCDRTSCRCRFDMQALPPAIQVSSQTRHNISMSVKEAVHNVLKHAKASLVTVRMTFVGDLLTVSVQDDGCGFQAGDDPPAGNGLTNMRTRLEALGGKCLIESRPGQGTTVHLCVVIRPLN